MYCFSVLAFGEMAFFLDMKFIKFKLPSLFSLLASLLVMPCVLMAQTKIIWSEEFNSGSQPDAATWSYDLGAGGWGNNEIQTYTDSPGNVRIENGHLVITVLAEEGGFTSGRVRSQDKLTFRYATVEARIQVPDLADGLWPAFWTMGNAFSSVGWPASGEIDIMEMGQAEAIANSVVNQRVGSAAHWEQDDEHVFFTRSIDTDSPLNGAFHLFRLEWTPGSITTYVDGTPVWVMDITPEACLDCSEFHDPHFFLLNVAVGGTYPDLFTPGQITAPVPAEMRVDYIRIFDNGFTEIAGSSLDEHIPDIGPGHSGSWIPVAESAHGFSVEFGYLPDGSPFGVVYWYVYDALGEPIFFVGTGVPDGNVLDVTFESPVGMRFGEFDPDTVTREDGGTGRLVFSDRDNAVFTYSPSEFSQSRWGHTAIEAMPMVRLFEVPVEAPEF